MAAPRVLAFDVNDTLLDLSALDARFSLALAGSGGGGSAGEPPVALRRAWFSQLVELALASTVTRQYRSYAELGGAALDMVAAARGAQLGAAERSMVVEEGMVQLPAYPEVRDSLRELKVSHGSTATPLATSAWRRTALAPATEPLALMLLSSVRPRRPSEQEAGFTLVALTNGTMKTVTAQLLYAGLDDCFAEVFSADDVQRLKPAPEPYQMVVEKLGVLQPSDVWMVAAHAWDLMGAQAAGLHTVFIARPGKVLSPLMRVDCESSNMVDITRQLWLTSWRGLARQSRRLKKQLEKALKVEELFFKLLSKLLRVDPPLSGRWARLIWLGPPCEVLSGELVRVAAAAPDALVGGQERLDAAGLSEPPEPVGYEVHVVAAWAAHEHDAAVVRLSAHRLGRPRAAGLAGVHERQVSAARDASHSGGGVGRFRRGSVRIGAELATAAVAAGAGVVAATGYLSDVRAP
eukprot:SM000033S12363  [mRNA]  locus=s33:451600:453748:- [translate_table: standard]